MRRRGAKPMRGACWMMLLLNSSSLLNIGWQCQASRLVNGHRRSHEA
jgi:hypothetical protein